MIFGSANTKINYEVVLFVLKYFKVFAIENFVGDSTMELNNDMYEFYGILMGDGCISRYFNQSKQLYEIRIDGSSITDIDYYKYLVNLISSLSNTSF